ncbi:MAG: hypothetical protein ACRCW9_06050 [Cetobacterium sp.]
MGIVDEIHTMKDEDILKLKVNHAIIKTKDGKYYYIDYLNTRIQYNCRDCQLKHCKGENLWFKYKDKFYEAKDVNNGNLTCYYLSETYEIITPQKALELKLLHKAKELEVFADL